MTSLRFLLLAAVTSVAAAFVSPAVPVASTLYVTVDEVGTSAVVRNAQVRLPSLGRIARTNEQGVAEFGGIARGKYRVDVRAIGYEPGETVIEIDGATEKAFVHLEKIQSLDTVRVKASRAERHMGEFETRRAQNIGRFITQSTLAEDRVKGLQLLLVTRIPGLKAVGPGVKAMGGLGVGPSAGARVRRPMGTGCPVTVYLDGFELVDTDYDVVNLDEIKVDELAGVEVYNRINAPVQYRPPGTYCKVILLWTKW